MFSGTLKEKLRRALAGPVALAIYWLYRITIQLIPRIGSAEPTGTGEVFPSIRPITHALLAGIQKKTHGFWYAWEFVACWAGLFVLYAVMLWLAKGARARWFPAFVAIASIVFTIQLLLSPSMLSSDTYAYSYYGRLLAHYGVDAHAPAPASSLKDPFLLDGYYQFVPSVYGPLSTVISGAIVWAGNGHVGLTILLLRTLAAASALGTGGLIWLILKRLAPDSASFALVLFLWNPLVLIECPLCGHNDVWMMFLAMLAVWLHLRGWKAGAAGALMLSALIKVITAPLVPLYMLMVLRQATDWPARFRFLGRAALTTVAAILFSVLTARMNPSGLIIHTASSAQFFENNYHELLFKGLRRWLGEPADSIEAPMDFLPYWVATNGHATLQAGISYKSGDLIHLPDARPLLAVSDEDSSDWLRVYDPVSHLQGYIDWVHLVVIGDPPIADTDPVAIRIAGWPPDWPTVQTANRIIRIATWSLFIAFGLLAAWKTTDLDQFIWWSTAFFLASQLLVFTKIWPWYVVWPLAFGALKPTSKPTWFAILLSAGMPLLYLELDFSASIKWSWINDYRSVPAIVVPVVIFGVWLLWDRFTSPGRPRRNGAAQPAL